MRGSILTRVYLLGLLLLGTPIHLFAVPDIVFVTQPANPRDFATANATFGNHLATLDSIPRGGDLYIRYSNGNLKNITSAAGYGNSGFQGATSIAVRDPAVHWSGTKILFSMVVGAPTQQYQIKSYRWQIYEVTGIGESETPVITKVANQNGDYNNVMPIYGTNGRIIFVSDRPRAGLTHTYPQRDEYESTPTNTGLWSLDASNGDVFQLDHSPSGDFNPTIDSFGRVTFIRWDHLQRDQQNRCSQSSFGAYNFSSEDANATALDSDAEVYPEPRANCEKTGESNLENHSFNLFLPWMVNEDGTELETINHIGRHELTSYLGKSFNNDSNIVEFYSQYTRFNQKSITNFFHIQEDPTTPGAYFGINAPEFGTHTSGQIIRMYAPPSLTADKIEINYITHPDTANTSSSPDADHTGLVRDPLPLSDGTLIASHSGTTLQDTNTGTTTAPQSHYSFRLRNYTQQGSYFAPAGFLTSGITKTVSFWSPDQMISYNNAPLWELQAREIRSRSIPSHAAPELASPEKAMFDQAQVNIDEFKQYLRENNLAVIVSRNITTRDELDRQQPFNLQVAGSSTSTIPRSGKVYDVSLLQIFQGDLIRAYTSSSGVGRRVIAQPLHSVSSNIPVSSSVPGAVEISPDGSLAAFVPARQALTYQLTDSEGTGIVRERLWLTFQPGEIRVCASCHGVNGKDQSGNAAPTNSPLALKSLLEYWKGIPRQENPFTMKLTLSSKKPKTTHAAKQVTVKVAGQGLSAANKSISLKAKIGKTNCGTLISFTTDSSGRFSKASKKLPFTQKRTSVAFSIEYGDKKLDTKKLELSQRSSKATRPAKLCSALKASFVQ